MRLLVLATGLSACLYNGADDPKEEPLGGSRTVAGKVVDFQSGAAVDGAASVSTSGVVPPPKVTVHGADFTIDGIPDNSTFQILASVPPTHHATFGPSIDVLDANIDGVVSPALAETYLQGLATAFAVNPSAAKGVLIVQLVDGTGAPKAGIASSELVIAGGVDGPHFLDADLVAAPAAGTSSASGFAVFFEVPPGVVQLGQAAQPTVTLEMPASPVTAAVVTLARIKVTAGPPTLPTNVSFSRDIVPIFGTRGCVACHSGGGIGKELAGLKLDGPSSQVYGELVTEDPTRVRTATPETSLVLTMPSREDPPDNHPNVTWTSNTDPDYLKLLVWIREGAKDN